MRLDVIEFCLMITMGTPVIAVLWFLGSIFFYIKCPKESAEKKSKRRGMIASGVVAVLLVSAFIWLIIQFSQAIEHM